MEKKTYTSQELNEIIGYIDKTGHNSSKTQLITRCKNAGLIIQALDTPRGVANKYIIIEDNFHLEGEEWRTCYCNEDWEISSLGRARRKTTKKLMGYSNAEKDYVRICMVSPETGKTTNKQLHRLVYFTFHPELIEYENSIQIDHINGVRTDNRLDNLQPLTAIENTQKRDECQNRIRSLITDLVVKYGYEKVEKKLILLLTNGLECDII